MWAGQGEFSWQRERIAARGKVSALEACDGLSSPAVKSSQAEEHAKVRHRHLAAKHVERKGGAAVGKV